MSITASHILVMTLFLSLINVDYRLTYLGYDPILSLINVDYRLTYLGYDPILSLINVDYRLTYLGYVSPILSLINVDYRLTYLGYVPYQQIHSSLIKCRIPPSHILG